MISDFMKYYVRSDIIKENWGYVAQKSGIKKHAISKNVYNLYYRKMQNETAFYNKEMSFYNLLSTFTNYCSTYIYTFTHI